MRVRYKLEWVLQTYVFTEIPRNFTNYRFTNSRKKQNLNRTTNIIRIPIDIFYREKIIFFVLECPVFQECPAKNATEKHV